MKDTLDKIEKLHLKIEKLKAASKENDVIIEAMIQQAEALPIEVKEFVDRLPDAVTCKIHQAIDVEFNTSPDGFLEKQPNKLAWRIPRGIRI